MAAVTLKITGLSEDILGKIDERAKRQGSDRNGYLRELIERDLTSKSLGEAAFMLDACAPVQEEFARSGMTDADLDALIEEARNQVRQTAEMTHVA